MENRFGLKDLILSILLIALIASVWLAMKQFDRQWGVVRSINDKLDAQTRELAQLRRDVARVTTILNERPPVTIMSPPPTQPAPAPQASAQPADPAPTPAPPQDRQDAFDRIRAARAQPGYAEGDWLVDAFSGGVAKVTPLLSGDVYASIVQDHVLDSLATRDPDTLEWKGVVARDWQISPDGLTITFQLRENVTFSDGQPLTADDIVFTFNFIMDPSIDAPRQRAYYKTIASVTRTGPHEVVFKYHEPYFEAFALAASFAILPRHFYSAHSPKDFNQSVGLLLGSGPYRMEDPSAWKPGSLLQLVRNDRYWSVPPAFDRLIYKEINNDVARLTAFRNGDNDLFPAQPEQYRLMLADQDLVSRTQHYEYLSPIGGYRFIAWNQQENGQPTRFADRRVRQAMTMLTDCQRLVQEVMLGYAVPATGPFNPKSKQSSPDVQPWPYDVDRAKRLLAEAGYQDRNGDGVLEATDGSPFQFKLTYPSGNANYEKMALFLKDSYARAGIILEPEPLEWSVFTDRLSNKNFLAITLGWTSGIETDIYQMFHSSQMIKGGDDFVSYKNGELDTLIEQARRTVDEDQRMPLWRRCHQVLHEDQPYTFLFFSKSLRFMDKRIRNIQQLGLGLNPDNEWWVPSPQQRWTR